MGLSVRTFIFDEDGSMMKIGIGKYDRLWRREEAFPEYAGKKLRCSQVCIQLENRRPVDIIRVDYIFISFDRDGYIDAGEVERKMQFAGNMLGPIFSDYESNILDMGPDISRRLYSEEFMWTPTSSEIESIESAIFDR